VTLGSDDTIETEDSTEDEAIVSEVDTYGGDESESDQSDSVTLGSKDTIETEDEIDDSEAMETELDELDQLDEAMECNSADEMINDYKSDGDTSIAGSDDTAIGIEESTDDELGESYGTEDLLMNDEEVDELDSEFEY
jgi:hypothetical protein